MARSPLEWDSALHSLFEWDDSKAAHEYRLEQARHIIRAQVIFNEIAQDKIRIYVSLPEDRGVDSYRPVVAVLSETQKRQQLLACALAELQAFSRKYKVLTELANVFKEIERLRGT